MSIITFQEKSIAKGELADKLNYGTTFDCALPQTWLDKIRKRFPDDQLEKFGNLSSHFVYVYDDELRSEYIAPLTKTGCKILGILSLYS